MIHKDARPTFQWNVDKPKQTVVDLQNFITEQIASAVVERPPRGKFDIFSHLTEELHFHVIIFLEPGFTREICCSLSFHNTPKERRALRNYGMLQVKMGCLELNEYTSTPDVEKIIQTSIIKKGSDTEYFVSTNLITAINYFENQLLEALEVN